MNPLVKLVKLVWAVTLLASLPILAQTDRPDPVRSEAFSELATKSWRVRDYRLAYAHALDALRFNQNNVEANLIAARFAIAEMLGPQEWGTTLERAEGDIEAYVEERAEEAIDRLGHILVIDPGHVSARLLLGMVYYENEMFHRLVGLFEDYRRGSPEKAEPYFMLSLALSAQGDEEHGKIAFAHGLKRLAQDDRYLRAGFILHEPTEQTPEALGILWAREDPLLLTPTNERLMEHFQRVAYANLRFSEDAEMRTGWESDRGRVYIRYGAPAERYIATSSVGPDQLWSYPDFSVAFMRPRSSPWTYRNGIVDRKEFRTINDLAKTFPPKSQAHSKWTRFASRCRPAQFKGSDAKTRIDFNVTFRDGRIKSSKGPKGSRRVNVDHSLFVLDDEWKTLKRRTEHLDYLTWLSGDSEGGYFVRIDDLELDPGEAHVYVESADRLSKGIGVFEDTIQVRAFEADVLALSDIVVNRRSIKRSADALRADRVFLPAPDGIGVRGKVLEAYAEVYNLGVFDAPDSSRFSVQLAVRPKEDPQGWVVVLSEVRRGGGRDEAIALKFSLAQAAPGPKVIRVRVTDHARSETIEETADFRVRW